MDTLMPWISKVDTYLNESEQMNNAQLVINHFIGTDWVKESISALLGNMSHESTMNPNLYEMGYGHSPSRGYGLVQWTPATKLWDWCNANGLDWKDGDAQLSRIDYEVENNIQWIPKSGNFNGLTFKEFRTNSRKLSVEQLTEAFTWGYERPNQSAGESSMPKRKAFALKCFNELDWTGTGEGGGGGICFIFPTDTQRITSGFRPPDRPDHHGVDFAEAGTHPIFASASGVVSKSYVSSSYGEVIMIVHNINGEEYETLYAHMQKGSRTLWEGATVTQGQTIGIMGSTGDSTGQHLHFEIHKPRWNDAKSNAIDPMTLLGKGGCGGGDNGGGGNDKPNSNNKLISLLLSDALNGWKW